jgi:ubiquinone/menaquinone biosynthesis C-methylase UbiE
MDDRMTQYTETVRSKIHSSGLLGRANHSLHQALERGRSGQVFADVLEIGSGDLEHLAYVEHACSQYVAVDLRAPKDAEARIRERSPRIASVETHQMDGMELSFADESFDRVLATCVIMHVDRPDHALSEWLRVTKRGGVVDFLVPCDPGLVLRLFRWFVNERVAGRFGVSRLEYRLLNALDHISSFARIDELVRMVVRENNGLNLSKRYFPFLLPSWNLNGFVVYTVRKN